MKKTNAYEAARQSNAKATSDLLSVATGKAAAAKLDPNADRSKQVVERARREGWTRAK